MCSPSHSDENGHLQSFSGGLATERRIVHTSRRALNSDSFSPQNEMKWTKMLPAFKEQLGAWFFVHEDIYGNLDFHLAYEMKDRGLLRLWACTAMVSLPYWRCSVENSCLEKDPNRMQIGASMMGQRVGEKTFLSTDMIRYVGFMNLDVFEGITAIFWRSVWPFGVCIFMCNS